MGEFEETPTSVDNMTHTDLFEAFPYDKTASVEPFTLIAEVKKYQVLYNKQLVDYASNVKKEQVWELIHSVIFPNYEELNIDTKEVIKKTVRKRWKSLRDALVKDHRLRSENPAYSRKKMSPMVEEMQFLLPFIKNPHPKLNIHFNSTGEKQFPDFSHSIDENTIDLTFQDDTADSHIQLDGDVMVKNEALYPSVRLTISDGDDDSEGDYTNNVATELNYTICEVEEPQIKEFKPASVDEITNNGKRKRTNSEEDLHTKLNELIYRCNEEYQDEDRMFLLSLLSDFKRVPVQKKLKVKAVFVRALDEALDSD